MNKKVIIIIAVVVVLAAAGFGIYKFTCKNKTEIKPEGVFEPKNGTYLIDNKEVVLKDGYFEAEIMPGAASKDIVKYFGNEVKGDFDNDGKEDVVFLLTREMGGSGVFYYVAALLGSGTGTNALPIGDRIAPQTTEFRNGMIIVNYADRKPDEDFSAEPSVGVSRYFKIVDGTLLELMPALSESEAKTIAEKSCIKGGEALSEGTYNENTKTWWFDANLNATREGCNPACVVSEETKKAEINWRCTGLLEGKEGIEGTVSQGPTCPVEKNPPDPNCADKPYAGATVMVKNAAGDEYIEKTGTDGKFRIAVPAGSYTVTVAPINIFPSCEENDEVAVEAGKFTSLDISCDTGIR